MAEKNDKESWWGNPINRKGTIACAILFLSAASIPDGPETPKAEQTAPSPQNTNNEKNPIFSELFCPKEPETIQIPFAAPEPPST